MKSRESSSWISSGSMRSISPTRPMSTSSPSSVSLFSSILRAWMNAPSCPVRPTALPPCWLMSPTISWLSSPSTISTTFITLVVGDAHALPELALDAHLLQQVADLRAAAVHDHRVHADQLQHHDVAREARLERGLGHRVAAVLDDDRLVVEALDVGQRLGQDLRLEGGVDGVDRHDGVSIGRCRVCGDCTRRRPNRIRRAAAPTSEP